MLEKTHLEYFPFNGLAIVAGGVTTNVTLADKGLHALARASHEASYGDMRPCKKVLRYVVLRSFMDLQPERVAKMRKVYISSLNDLETGREIESEETSGKPVMLGEVGGRIRASARIDLLVG